jgi:hypothetical protein
VFGWYVLIGIDDVEIDVEIGVEIVWCVLGYFEV